MLTPCTINRIFILKRRSLPADFTLGFRYIRHMMTSRVFGKPVVWLHAASGYGQEPKDSYRQGLSDLSMLDLGDEDSWTV